jgi:hypothetical protein
MENLVEKTIMLAIEDNELALPSFLTLSEEEKDEVLEQLILDVYTYDLDRTSSFYADYDNPLSQVKTKRLCIISDESYLYCDLSCMNSLFELYVFIKPICIDLSTFTLIEKTHFDIYLYTKDGNKRNEAFKKEATTDNIHEVTKELLLTLKTSLS